jgi:pimeloyl-ACP methyl ester carboxylesterase
MGAAAAAAAREVGMNEVVREGVTLAYRDEGEGPAIILLHGHTLDGRVFDPLVPGLEARGLRVIRPDLRGHGRSTRPPQGYHWSHHGADVAAVLDAAGVERAAVAGFSLGGGIALELAVTTPARVESLCLIDPVMPDRPFEEEFMASLKEVARTARTDGIQAAMAGPWLRCPLFTASLERPGVRDRLEAIVRDFPGAEYLAEARDRVERDWTVPERLAEIAVPTLVMVGGRDLPGFQAYADEAARGIPGARLEVIDGCGHLLPLEAPERVLELLLDHLGRPSR